jgi:glycyl-tRNA synthetase beta chain
VATKAEKSTRVESLLVELLTEELPPKSLRLLGEVLKDRLLNKLVQHQLKLRVPAEARFFATPRRLAVYVPEVSATAQDRETEVPGPSANAPAQAVAGFAKKNGVGVDQLERRAAPKGEIFVARVKIKGAVLDEVLAHIVEDVLKALPVPKVMRWGAGEAQFVRPVHGLVMLHGSRVVPGRVLGLVSGNLTQGHRFLGKSPILLRHADDYEAKLRKDGWVIADFAARREAIERQLQTEAARQKADLGTYQDLLDEVTALVEYPQVYAGNFDASFLEVPQECLILTMRQNQKYFPLLDPAGKLLPRFLIVSNMKVADPRPIVAGNERVVRPRLEDARFFYGQDRKQPLRDRVEQLKSVIYYRDKLGSQYDRTMRIKSLAGRIAHALGGNVAAVKNAAELSKADLLTGMVGEFPELQGIMGRYYALNDGESAEVADAIEQHYRPRFAGDRLPENLTASVLALADKLEAIVGMFGIGQEPTGDRDPFALRRSALGIVRILIERQIEIGLQPLVDMAIGEMPSNAQPDWARVVKFIFDRARSYFLEKGFAAPAIEGVIQPFGYSSPLYTLLGSVAEASRIIATEEGRILAEANKRITSILKKSGFPVPFGFRPDQLIEKPNPELFREKEEIEFWNALQEIGGKSLELKHQHRYAESLSALSKLAIPTKSFFDHVLVNAKEPDIQNNRITLLQHARAYMNQVADLSLMAA